MRRVAQAILRTYLSRILALGLGGRQLRREYYVGNQWSVHVGLVCADSASADAAKAVLSTPGYRLLVGSFRASEKLFRYAACEWCRGREELRANDGKHRGRRYLHLT